MKTYLDQYFSQGYWPAVGKAIDALLEQEEERTSPDGTSPSGTSPDAELEEWRRLTQPLSRRPLAWQDFVGNEAAVETLREAITAAELQGKPMPHTILFGPAGVGKTTLARLVANTMGGGYLETTASTLETQLDVARLLIECEIKRKQTGRPTTIFVDELHALGQARGRLSVDQETMFPVLEDWTLFHSQVGKSVDIDGVTYTLNRPDLRIGPFTLVGATTEVGMLSAPMLRRLLIHIEMRPYSDDDIVRILTGVAERLGWPIDEDAAIELAKFSRKNPGVAQQRLTAANNRRVASGSERITIDVVNDVISRLKLFPLGLTQTDIDILRVLADRAPRGAGQLEISRAVSISSSTFGLYESYLRALGFVETLARRQITWRGLAYLAELGFADPARPEVRAAISRAKGGA